jgi:hypothetical protein
VKSPQETSFHASALLWLKVSLFISTPSGLDCKIHQITTALPINIAESQSFSESSPSSMTRNARAVRLPSDGGGLLSIFTANSTGECGETGDTFLRSVAAIQWLCSMGQRSCTQSSRHVVITFIEPSSNQLKLRRWGRAICGSGRDKRVNKVQNIYRPAITKRTHAIRTTFEEGTWWSSFSTNALQLSRSRD